MQAFHCLVSVTQVLEWAGQAMRHTTHNNGTFTSRQKKKSKEVW